MNGPTKIYRGHRDKGEHFWDNVKVTVEEIHDDGTTSRRALKHHERHSPDGFAWGYDGSGPADLARCILIDFFGREPTRACYQDFKQTYVARWKGVTWALSSQAIDHWFDQWLKSEQRVKADSNG